MNAPGRLRPAERAALHAVIAAVVDSGHWVLGPEVEAFEAEFGAALGTGTGCVGVANGTDALELALRAVGVRAGDRVATVANAGGYASAAVLTIGATPWFVDVGHDLQLDVGDLSAAWYAGCRAVVVTHLYGIAADVEAIVASARHAGAAVVEDCAQAHGLRIAGQPAGTFGDAAAFSFYPTKNLGALGDAGAVVSGRRDVLDTVRRLRQYGWTERYMSDEWGRNSRMDEVQAAVLRWRLGALGTRNRRRADVAARYRERAPGLAWVADHGVHHLCVLLADERDTVAKHLTAAGVQTAIHYPVADHQQAWAVGIEPRPLPTTERATRSVLSVPCFPELRDDEVETVAGVLASLPGAL